MARYVPERGDVVWVNFSPTEGQDYANFKGLSREEQEKRLLELAETGQTIAAIGMARRLYAYDLTEARGFVENLRRSKAVAPAPSKNRGYIAAKRREMQPGAPC